MRNQSDEVAGTAMSDNDQNDDLAAEQASASQKTVASVILSRIFIAQLVIAAALAGWVFFSAFVNPDRLGAFYISALCGAIGGSLALLKRIRSQDKALLDELESSTIATLMPFLYGAILASITYLLFMGCILTGDGAGGLFTSNLFPQFNGLACVPKGNNTAHDAKITMEQLFHITPGSAQDFAKLLIWSVLSGYSEKFVDQVLRALERR